MVGKIITIDNDRTRKVYAKAVKSLGEKKAHSAFARAFNHRGRVAFTAVKRGLVKQTSAPRPVVNASLSFKRAIASNISVEIRASGQHLSLRKFNPRQFSYGVRAKVWGRSQQFRSAFIVDKLNGQVFKREGAARFPIAKLWGPSIPKELLKDDVPKLWSAQSFTILKRVEHEITRLLP